MRKLRLNGLRGEGGVMKRGRRTRDFPEKPNAIEAAELDFEDRRVER